MGQLTNQYVSSSFQGLLKMTDSTQGLTNTLQTIQTGDGDNSPLQMSLTEVNISGSFYINNVPITNGTDGTSGTSGSNGTDGSSGTSGSNGTDGSSGTSGSNGSDGSSGTSGSNGTDGSSGTSGSNGTDGSSGTSGSNGTDGSSGSSGSNGTNGSSGTSGLTDKTGLITTGSIATTQSITGSLIVSGSQLITGSLSTSQDILVNGLTVGKGGGNILTNIAIGAGALRSNTTAQSNVAIGSGSLGLFSIGGGATALNTAIGTNIMSSLGSGSFASINSISQNTMIGGNAGQSIVSGSRNTVIGAFAMQSANNVERNTGLGRGVLSALGSSASNSIGSGSRYNSAFGHNAMFQFISGSNNVVINGGSNAGDGFFLGSKNNYIGPDALLPTTGSANTIIGYGLTLAQMGGNNASGSVVISDGNGNIAFSKYGGTGSFNIPSNTNITGSLSVSSLSTSTGSFIVTTDSTGTLTKSPYSAVTSNLFSVGDFYSTQTQTLAGGVSGSVTYNNTGTTYGVSLVSSSQLTIANAGVYSITFSAQIKGDGGQDTVYIWLKKNGTNVADTATKIVAKNNEEDVMTVEYIVQASASDYYELAWQNTTGDGDLAYYAASGNIPAIPSIITSVKQIR